MDEEKLIAEIRRAAFELRHTDAQEAVRVLRRCAGAGGGAEVLARGALGEIYLDEFGDLDGAEHEFRRVLEIAPGLFAAELGLARTRLEAGDEKDAALHYERALTGMARDLEGFRAGKQEIPEGIEELVLTALETAVELAELRRREVPLDEELLRWAQAEDFFTSSEEDEAGEDWARFHTLWTALRLATGRAEEALVALRSAESDGQLSTAQAAQLLSRLFEDLGDAPRAGAEARRMLAALPPPWPLEEVLRAGHLTGARDLLETALTQERPAGERDELRAALGLPKLVGLRTR